MGKKRGGRRHRNGSKASEEVAVVAEDAVEHPEEGDISSEPQSRGEDGTSNRGKRGSKGNTEVSEYFAHIKKLIEECPFQGTVQFEAFITSTVQEILKRGLLVVSDQKCSRVVEKLIALMANFIAFQEGGRKPTFESGESTEEENLQSRLRCLDSYLSLLRAIAPVAPNLATHPNGSHVLQTLLNSIPAVVEFESKHKNTTDQGEAQNVEDFFLFMLGKLKSEGGGWLQLLRCAMGSHIFRSSVRAAAGIDCLVPADVAGHRSRRKTRRDREETLTSPQVSAALMAVLGKAGQNARLAKVPKAFFHELNAIADAVAVAVAAEPFSLPFDVYAAPSLQGSFSSTEEFVKIADALVDSPTGSRILEVSLPLLAEERFQLVFAHWMVKKLNDLAQGRFGNFILQKVLQASIFQSAHLKQFVQALDFAGCLNAATSAVLWRCAEACRRLQVCYKEFAKKMFEAVGVKGGSATRYAWWCLLTLCLPEDLPSELMPERGDTKEGDEAAKTLEDTQEERGEEREHDTSSLIRMHDRKALRGYVVQDTFVCSCQPEVKRQIVEALLPLEEELKTKNYAAYMKCEIYRYTKDKEEWQARQEKRNKTRNLFKSILATSAVEAEDEGGNEENGLSKILKASNDDPIAQHLTLEVGNSEKEKNGVKKKKRKKDDEEEVDFAIDSTLDAEAAQNIDRVFLEAFDAKQQQLSKRKRSNNTMQASGEAASSEPSCLDPSVKFRNENCGKDPTLDAALFFIEGTSDSLSKRERARRRKLEVSFG
ncbi:hypothetical protein ACSSS7_000005 [Eimeria intestinalis]